MNNYLSYLLFGLIVRRKKVSLTPGVGLIIILVLSPISLTFAQTQPFFGVAPAKIEMRLKPGESRTEFVTIVNRLGGPAEFSAASEDYGPRLEEKDKGIIGLQPAGASAYSLRPYLAAELPSFILADGEQRQVPLTVSLPEESPLGSLHGAVAFSARRLDSPKAAASLSSRIAVLLFVRVEGQAIESGRLTSFGLSGGQFYFGRPAAASAYISYENNGNTYVNPYGYVEAKNIFTRKTSRLPVDPWFVLPYSERTRDISLEPLSLRGPQILTLRQNRGYGDIVDTKSELALFVPREFLVGGALIAALIAGGLFWLVLKSKRYEN